MSGARAEELQEDGRICLNSCTRMRMELMCALLVACWCAGAGGQYSSDQCSWRGSGLTHEAHARDVEQVYLRCSEGSLEWLYPTGAIIINLRPNTVPERSADAPMLACVKPRGDSRGSSLYVERAGVMRMLLSEEEQESRRVRCFRLDEGALFIQASAHSDISKRVTAFQYQLIRGTGDSPTDACRPCSDDEILMAACTSDFVVRGSIQSSVDDDDDKEQASLVLSVHRVFRQKHRIFRPHGRGRWSGRIRLPSHCGIRVGRRPGLGEFLFTGAVRFGEAWLSCAPRYRDFLQLYRKTAESGSNPCEIDVD